MSNSEEVAAGPVTTLNRREQLLDAFESAWQRGERPALEKYLPPQDMEGTPILAELIRVDLECRIKAGEKARLEEYLGRFPELSQNHDTIIALISHEYGCRKSQQPTPTVEEYLNRFPEYREELTRQGGLAPSCLDADFETATLTKGMEEKAAPDSTHSPVDPNATLDHKGSPAVSDKRIGSGMRYVQHVFHAEGGLGQVYKAQDTELGRQVALKRMKREVARHTESRRRFLREAEITGRLEHPGIVPVYGLVQDEDGQPCYAMRLIRGETLQHAADRYYQGREKKFSSLWGSRRPALEFRRLLERFLAVCETVAYAHSRGILHRDIKPANVMLGPFGETLVMDWGLAKVLDRSEEVIDSENQELFLPSTGEPNLTQIGSTLGTPAFMSPEQAAGRLDSLGPASDVYSLGATLYYLLTGEAPFAETRIQDLLKKVQNGDFVRPRQRNRSSSPALEAICMKAMEREPENRYQTVAEMATDVEHWLADEPVSVYADWLPQLWRWAYYHPLVSTLAFVLFLLFSAAINYVFDLGVYIRAPFALRQLWLPLLFLLCFVVGSVLSILFRMVRSLLPRAFRSSGQKVSTIVTTAVTTVVIILILLFALVMVLVPPKPGRDDNKWPANAKPGKRVPADAK